MIICCVFYLIWWSFSYRPEVEVNRAGGLNGVLLLITAFCGISGTLISVYGTNGISKNAELKITGTQSIICWVVLYVLLFLITKVVLHRQVTTELFLITGWAMLELTVISSLNGAGRLTGPEFWILLLIVAVALIISMVLYVQYYRMEEMRAFYAAMVPLITEAVSMGIVVFVTLL